MSSLWKQNDPSVWFAAYDQIDANVVAKVANTKSKKENHLIKDDKWIWNDLHSSIQSRDEKGYITNQEISRIMRWKLSRGQFRPRLQQLIESNSSQSVISTSKKSFNMLKTTCNNGGNYNKNELFYDLKELRSSINELCELKGVGAATASLILACKDHIIPFMADEAISSVGLPMRYHISTYIKLANLLQNKCIELNKIIMKNDDNDNNNGKIANNKNKNKDKNQILKNSSDKNPKPKNEKNTQNNNNDGKEMENVSNDNNNNNNNNENNCTTKYLTPFMLSQCLWSYTMSEKYGTSTKLDKNSNNVDNNNDKVQTTKKNIDNSDNSTGNKQLSGHKRGSLDKLTSNTMKTIKNVVGNGVDASATDNDNEDDQPLKKRRRVSKK